VNGALYSLLAEPVFREQAKSTGLEDLLVLIKNESDEQLQGQINFVIDQLNSGIKLYIFVFHICILNHALLKSKFQKTIPTLSPKMVPMKTKKMRYPNQIFIFNIYQSLTIYGPSTFFFHEK
jgi:hypothetical protein